jgi:hypothetical protein
MPLGHQPSRPGLLPAFNQNTKPSAICFFGCKFQRQAAQPTSAAMLVDWLCGATVSDVTT